MIIIKFALLFVVFVGIVAFTVSFLLLPIALYRGFKNKNWGMSKIVAVAYPGGLVLIVIGMLLYAITGGSGQ